MQHLQPNTTLQGGKYRIERVLGQGGFGNTYVGVNTVFNERIAIKEFFMQGINDRDEATGSITISIERNKQQFQEQLEKFKKEALRIRKLDNSHIVRVHDLFEENGTAYYVMDYVDGENLSERLKRIGKPMTESEVRLILPQILDALKSVHDAGIWHLDLKPANIMVDKAGNVKLIDFGASKQLNAQKGGATTSTAISYTNGYAPREQMEQNYDKFGPWTDIYALGATLYNLLTNKRPPLPSDIDDDDSNDKHQSLSFPDGVNDNLKKMVLQLMQTKCKSRPQTIDEVSAILKQQPARSEGTVEKPAQINVEESEDSEETIIATPKSESNVVEQRATSEPNTTPKPSPKVENIIESDDSSENSSVWKIVITIAVGIVVIILIYNGGLVRESDAQEPAVQETEVADATMKAAKEKESAAEKAKNEAEQKAKEAKESADKAKTAAYQAKSAAAEKLKSEAEQNAKEAKEAADKAKAAADQAKSAADAILKSRNDVIAQLTKIKDMQENAQRKQMRSAVAESLKVLAEKDAKHKSIYDSVREKLGNKVASENTDMSKGHYNILIKNLQSIK